MLALVWLMIINNQQSSRETKYIEQSSQLLMLSQRIAKDAREAVLGQKIAFNTLKDSRNQFETIVTNLRSGSGDIGIPATPTDSEPGQALEAVVKLWSPKPGEGVRASVDTITQQEKALFAMHEHVEQINQSAPLLLTILDEIIEDGTKYGMRQRDLNLVSLQGVLSQRIAKDVNIFAQGGNEAAVAASSFGKDMKTFKQSIAHLQAVAPAALRPKIERALKVFGSIEKNIEGILGSASDLFISQRASQQIFESSDPMLKASRTLVDAYVGGAARYLTYATVASGVLAALFLSLLAFRIYNDQRVRVRDSDAQNRSTQDSILKLLDEMGDLADGDLSIQPEVTEQITGAIADSINYAVREMRNLVSRIKNAAQQVAVASEHSRQTATELTEATLRQAAQITDASNLMMSMARSMDDMSKSAERSAEVAQGSVSTAKRGALAVQDTIRGMDQMREQIQETAKRIKRLGESSQQIGEIVELINDIAEQTNILSLNAAIQAAMAGEAGRGFAVVADEVQRLAERSAEATKQIADLVKTIQADTNEAVASMEQATQGVVSTTRLADAAGQALGEIESVSEQLSNLIVNIARDAHRQSESATTISGTMAKIQEATTMTSTGTRQTADSIGKLSDLARELQASVAGFKLPTA
ncbi:MAG: hypothetical protein A2140_06490 [Candidatus Muproteobacteria bacterium RBG_16_62_13]|uniref:Chemotaxis protein n=1 Tax=Candidatus Muproteobacteria bacterium RBG_16_62_13 TaxID=1817756 RepID=A0A1F6SXU6_9PROT|nr:MAG: hypothetical protein A2140_06490 [Candidatus Muproteobacteria bacterium RBG_16_62_13]